MSQFESQVAEKVRQAVLARLPRAMQAASEVELATLRLEIGWPYPPSGPVGGYPALRTGDLQGSLTRMQEIGSDYVKETLVADTPYAADVERGHALAEARPFMDLTKTRVYKGDYARVVAQVLRSGE